MLEEEEEEIDDERVIKNKHNAGELENNYISETEN